jgi:hypothetical protein
VISKLTEVEIRALRPGDLFFLQDPRKHVSTSTLATCISNEMIKRECLVRFLWNDTRLLQLLWKDDEKLIVVNR